MAETSEIMEITDEEIAAYIEGSLDNPEDFEAKISADFETVGEVFSAKEALHGAQRIRGEMPSLLITTSKLAVSPWRTRALHRARTAARRFAPLAAAAVLVIAVMAGIALSRNAGTREATLSAMLARAESVSEIKACAPYIEKLVAYEITAREPDFDRVARAEAAYMIINNLADAGEKDDVLFFLEDAGLDWIITESGEGAPAFFAKAHAAGPKALIRKLDYEAALAMLGGKSDALLAGFCEKRLGRLDRALKTFEAATGKLSAFFAATVYEEKREYGEAIDRYAALAKAENFMWYKVGHLYRHRVNDRAAAVAAFRKVYDAGFSAHLFRSYGIRGDILCNFEDETDLYYFSARRGRFARANRHVAHGEYSLEAAFRAKGAWLAFSRFSFRRWLGHTNVTFALYNPGDAADIELVITDGAGARYVKKLDVKQGENHISIAVRDIAKKIDAADVQELALVAASEIQKGAPLVLFIDNMRVK